MRILWLCSIMIPRIANALQMSTSNKEGWLTGLSDMIIEQSEQNQISLGICFPVEIKTDLLRGETAGIQYYSFHEETQRPWKYSGNYEAQMEIEMKGILEDFKPDLIHIFGTEYPHSLAMVNVCKNRNHILVGLQGLCFACAPVYALGVPRNIQKQFLFRDLIRWDNIMLQQRKFEKRGLRELQLINKITHVTGRTSFDRREVLAVNEKLQYHFMNEILRPEFYQSRWSYEKCQKYRIFMSQGNYPLKGLHFMLQALPEIRKHYPETTLYIAGDEITRYHSLKEKIKISSYGLYLLKLIKKFKLQEVVFFVGRRNSEEMCKEYLQSNVFVSASTLENSPNSVGEAMLLGVPVVSSRVGGVKNLLQDQEEGFLYEVEDITALASQVCKVFEQGAIAREMGNKARAHAMVTHDRSVNYHRLMDIYHVIYRGDY
jgi:glycosyltransferase involved in cell wall biosynthesis